MIRKQELDGTPKITCDNADCENKKHAYRPSPKNALKENMWSCKYCSDHSVDWDRIRKRDIYDIDRIKEELKKEWIRSEFWEKEIDKKSIIILNSMSSSEVRQKLRKELDKCVGKPKPFRDGYSVPIKDDKIEGKPFAYAQHATATCCTRCAHYWWGLEMNTQYTNDQLEFLTNIGMAYFAERTGISIK